MLYKKSIFNLVIEDKKDSNSVFVYNSRLGNMAQLSRKIYNFINENCFSDMDDKQINSLYKLGIIIPQNINETNFVLKKELLTMLGSSPKQLDIVIAPTMLCNLKCIYCFEENSCKQDNFNKDIADNVAKYLINYITKKPTVKTLRIKWFGGEPMLKYDMIIYLSKILINFCDKNNIKYISDIVTNGILLTKEKAIVFKENCKISSCQITLDGFETSYCRLKQATSQQYQSVIKNICDISDILRINLRLNCNEDNFNELKDLTKYLCVDLNLKNKISIYLSEIKSFECNKNFSEENTLKDDNCINKKIEFIKFLRDDLKLNKYFSPVPKPKSCHCLYMKHYNFIIGPSGEFYRCEHMIGQNDKVIGDSQNGFYYNDYDLSEHKCQHEKKCLTCPIFPICLSGCRDERKHISLTDEYCKSQIDYVINLLKLKLKNMNVMNIDSNI